MDSRSNPGEAAGGDTGARSTAPPPASSSSAPFASGFHQPGGSGLVEESNALVSSQDADMTSRGPSPSYRPSPSPSNTSHSDDQDQEDDDDVDDDDDDDDVFTDLASSSLNMGDRRNTLKARGSAALPASSSGANSSQSWQVTPANATKASAATLPHEILLHIFKYVAHSPPDLKRCLNVCKAWCLCGVELLWHRPAFPKLSSLFKLIHIIRRPDQTFPYATFIRRLNLAQLSGELEDSLFKNMAACTRLERLTLAGCSRLSDEAITAVLSNTKHLVAADLSDVPNLTDKSIYTIAENCQRLQGINLSSCRQLTSTSVATLARNSKLLRRVKLCNCENVGDEALQALAESCPVLLEVDLVGCPLITDASVREIWKHSHHLRELRLAQCGKLTDLAFPAPASSFAGSTPALGGGGAGGAGAGGGSGGGPSLGMPHPHHLAYGASDSAPTSRRASPMGRYDGHGNPGLVTSHSSDDTNSYPRNVTMPNSSPPMHTHLRPSRMFDHLRILDLTNCSTISDAAIEGIVSNVPRIRNLILAKCTRLTNESAYSIARLGKNLHYLHLGHVSNLTDRAVCHLARSCTRLRYIDLACCPQLTDLSVMELASNLPKLRRIGLVRVMNLTDQAIYSLVERYTCLERIHLSYCENVSVPAIFWLLQRLPRLTHLSLTGVPAFRRPELQSMCRPPPKEFNAHQRQAFCVYSGKGVSELRRFLQRAYSDGSSPHQFGELTPDIQRAWADMAYHQERHNASRRAAMVARNGGMSRQHPHLPQQQQQRDASNDAASAADLARLIREGHAGEEYSSGGGGGATAPSLAGVGAGTGAGPGANRDMVYDSWFRRLQQASLFAASAERTGAGQDEAVATAADVQRFLQEQMQIQREAAAAAAAAQPGGGGGGGGEGRGPVGAEGAEARGAGVGTGEQQHHVMPGSFRFGSSSSSSSSMPPPAAAGDAGGSSGAKGPGEQGISSASASASTPGLSGAFTGATQPSRPAHVDMYAANSNMASTAASTGTGANGGFQPGREEAAASTTNGRLAALATPPADSATTRMSFMTPTARSGSGSGSGAGGGGTGGGAGPSSSSSAGAQFFSFGRAPGDGGGPH